MNNLHNISVLLFLQFPLPRKSFLLLSNQKINPTRAEVADGDTYIQGHAGDRKEENML